MDIKKKPNEKLRPSFNCTINFPVRFQVSLTASEEKKFSELCEKSGQKLQKVFSPSKILKDKILKDLKCADGADILKNYPNIREANNELKKQILFSLGLYKTKNNVYFKTAINEKKEELIKIIEK